MVKFTRIRWVNFLSTGSAGNEINLTKTKTTLMTGKNGSGKSTGLTDALSFVCFGKPFRNINKPQLVNSINNKNCLVEVDFETNGKKYTVRRGMKPTIFEIWEDGILINQEASSRDYQKILENEILRFNWKTFTQVVILASATFVPFMELSKASRREVIEDILDIGVFSSMNEILKGEMNILKDELSEVKSQIRVYDEKIESQKKIIRVIESADNDKREELKNRLNASVGRLSDIKSEGKILEQKVSELDTLLKPQQEYSQSVKNLEKSNNLIKFQIGEIKNKQIAFFEGTHQCPTCSQEISIEHKEKMLIELSSTLDSLNLRKDVNESEILEYQKKIDELEKHRPEFVSLNEKLNTARAEYKIVLSESKILKEQLEKIDSNQNSDKEREIVTLNEITEKKSQADENRIKMLEQEQLKKQALVLLKDSGIKTSIIREYLNIINRKINYYLEEMQFFCQFHIDEQFNEVIKSRYRDQFTYASFSQGQKQRIDIAIMLTFREIAQMKNSMNTNLLVLDEIFSSSLDKGAVTFLINMLNDMKDSNIFVVTHHAEEFQDTFNRHIEFTEKMNFSTMREI